MPGRHPLVAETTVDFEYAFEATYDQALGNGALVTYSVGVHYQSEAETSPFDPNAATGLNPIAGAAPAGSATPFNIVARHPTYTEMEERTLLNANITYTSPNEKWYATLWGKNLLNETYRVGANSVGALWNFSVYGAPLQWGLELGINFE